MNIATKPPANAPDVVENLLKARWSCRSFKPDPLPQDIVERILTMSQHTASLNRAAHCNAGRRPAVTILHTLSPNTGPKNSP